jgi:hypothetical protein
MYVENKPIVSPNGVYSAYMRRSEMGQVQRVNPRGPYPVPAANAIPSYIGRDDVPSIPSYGRQASDDANGPQQKAYTEAQNQHVGQFDQADNFSQVIEAYKYGRISDAQVMQIFKMWGLI